MNSLAKRIRVVLVSSLALLLQLPGMVAAQELADEQTLRIGSVRTDISNLSPDERSAGGAALAVRMIFNGLVRYPDNPESLQAGEYGPELATDWEVSEDGTAWTFHLREGVEFHKGYGELTSEDVVYTYGELNTQPSWTGNYGVYEDWQVEAVDRYTVRITTEQADPFFLRNVADFSAGQIVSKAAVEEKGVEEFRLDPVGTGPFQFADYTPRENLVLERNEAYFRGSPQLERVEFVFMDLSSAELALRRGAIHVIASGPIDESWVNRMERFAETMLTTTGGMLFMQIDQAQEPFDDIRVRQALLHAIDRESMVQHLFGPSLSALMNGPVPDTFYGATADLPSYPYDPERSRELLAEAGYAEGFSIKSVISERPTYLQPAEVIQDQLAQVGIDVEWEVVDHTTFHERIRQGGSPVVIYGATREPFADVVLTQFYHGDSIVTKDSGITNFMNYDAVDELIDEAERTLDTERQLDLYAQAQRQIMEDAVVVPLAVRFTPWAYTAALDLGYDTSTPYLPDPTIELDERARLLQN